MRFVMLAEQDLSAISVEARTDVVMYEELVAQPEWHCPDVRLKAPRRARDVGFQEPRELDERFLVKTDEIELARRNAGGTEAVLDRVRGKFRVVFDACETFFLSRGDHAAVLHEAGRRIVIVGGEAQDALRHSKERVQERSKRT